MPGPDAAAIRALVGTLSSVTSPDIAVHTASPATSGTVPGSAAGTWTGAGIGTGAGVGDALGGGTPSPDTGGVGALAAPAGGGPATVGGSSFFAAPAVQFPGTATGGGGGGGGLLIGGVPNVPGPTNGDLTALLMMLRDRFRNFPGSPGSPAFADFAALITLLHTHFPDVDVTAFFDHLRDLGHVGGSLGDSNGELADFFAHLHEKFGDLGGSSGMSSDELADFFAHLHEKFGDLGDSSGMSNDELANFFAHLHDELGHVGGSLGDSNDELADFFGHLRDKFGDLGGSSGMSDHELAGFFGHLRDKFNVDGSTGSSGHELADFFGHLHDKFDVGGSMEMSNDELANAFAHLHGNVGDIPDSSGQSDRDVSGWGIVQAGGRIGSTLAGDHSIPRESPLPGHQDSGASQPQQEAQYVPRHALPDSSETQQQDQQSFAVPNQVPEPGLVREPSNDFRVDSIPPNNGYSPRHSNETQIRIGQTSEGPSTNVSTGNPVSTDNPVSMGNLSQPRHAKPLQNESTAAAGNRQSGTSSVGSIRNHKRR